MSGLFRKLSSASDRPQGSDQSTRRSQSQSEKGSSIVDDMIQQLIFQESLLSAHAQEGKKMIKSLGQVSKTSLRVSNDLSAGCRSQTSHSPIPGPSSGVSGAQSNLAASTHSSPGVSSAQSNLAASSHSWTGDQSDEDAFKRLFESIQELHTLNSMLVQVNEDFSSNMNGCVISPAKTVDKGVLNEVLNTHVKKREELISKIWKTEEKVSKLSKKDKTGDNLVNLHKLRQGLEQMKEEYGDHERLLMDQLPLLINWTSCDRLFQPSLESLIKSLLAFHGDRFTALVNCVGVKDKELGPWADYREEQEARIKQLEALSIVGSSNSRS